MPSAPQGPPDSPAPVSPADPPERYGPLLVERFVKDDGRKLVRFSRVEAVEREQS
jgi:hypothetical protein